MENRLTAARGRIDAFVELGERLDKFALNAASEGIVERACAANPWFTPQEVVMAVEAIRSSMLDKQALSLWLSAYDLRGVLPRDVAVIAAGNVPLVGFFDMLCVLIAGHNCLFKPSSKDRVLSDYIISLLRDIDPDIPIYALDQRIPQAVIATGSDGTNVYFRDLFGGIPSVLRSSRTSAAVLSGREGEQQLAGLARDIFSYSGLGCRNVSHLLLPDGYDTDHLSRTLGCYQIANPRYLNNYRQRAALLRMDGEKFTDGGFFILRQADEFPMALSEITYRYYSSVPQLRSFVRAMDDQLQCVVHDPAESGLSFSRSAAFGQSQSPSLTDYPDGVDLIGFLCAL